MYPRLEYFADFRRRTKRAIHNYFVLHIAVNTNVSEGFVFTAISSTKQILCQNSNICCGVSTFKLRKLNQIILLQGITEAINSRMSTYYETEIVLNSNFTTPDFPNIKEIRLAPLNFFVAS